jgi:hypothetical protein
MRAKQVTRAIVLVAAAAVVAGLASSAAEARHGAVGVSLTAKPSSFVYGANGVTVAFSGRVSAVQAGQRVTVLSQPCGFSKPHSVMTVKTLRGGSFTFSLQPGLNTVFSVRWRSSTKSVRIVVKPAVAISHNPATGYRVDVTTTGGAFFDGQAVAIQSWDGSQWAAAGSATLAPNSPSEGVTALSSGSFTPAAGATKLRALMPATACYAAATSAAFQG